MAVGIPPLFYLLLPALLIVPQAPTFPRRKHTDFVLFLFHRLFLLFLPQISTPLLGTHSLNRHTGIDIYSKAQSLTSRWDTLLREETGYSE